jgi:hypothetical protein
VAIANVQKPANPSTNELETNSAAASNSQAQAYNANVVAGNFLCILISWGDTNALAASGPVTDTQGNTWHLAKLEQGNGNSAAIYYCNALSSAANTVTVNWANATVAFPALYLYEFSGLPSAVTDGTSGGTGASSSTYSSGNIATANANDLEIALVTVSTTANTGTSGWTFLKTNAFHNGTEFNIVSSTGTYTAGMSGNSANYALAYAAFRPGFVFPAPSVVSISSCAVRVRITGSVFPASCSWTDVQAAVNSSVAGSTVFVPAGISFWSNTVIVPVPLTIIGAGTVLKRNPGFLLPFFSGTDWNVPSYTVTGILFDYIEVGSDRIGLIYPGKDFGQPFRGRLIDVWHGPLFEIMLPDSAHTWPGPAPTSYPSPDPGPFFFR